MLDANSTKFAYNKTDFKPKHGMDIERLNDALRHKAINEEGQSGQTGNNETSKAPFPNAGPNLHVIIYAVSGGAATFIILLLVIVVTLSKIVKRQREQIELTNEEIDEFMLGVAAEKVNSKGLNGLFVLPYDTKLEIPKSDITFRKNVYRIRYNGCFAKAMM